MPEILTTNRDTEYFDAQGLQTLTGLSQDRWNTVIVKELMDNALDAIEGQSEKQIVIEHGHNHFAVFDSGLGIPEATLDQIYDFSVYASSKREFLFPSRGCQGNALKTIIGISYLQKRDLSFISSGQRITRRIKEHKLNSGIVEFETEIESTNLSSGVVVTGPLEMDSDTNSRSLM